MKKNIAVLSLLSALVLFFSSCMKKDAVQHQIDKQELYGQWVKLPASGFIDTAELASYKQFVFGEDGRVRLLNGNFCNFNPAEGEAETGYNFYTETEGAYAESQKLIKFEACGGGFPIRLEGDRMYIGFSGEAVETYQRYTEPEEPEQPENPEDNNDESGDTGSDDSGADGSWSNDAGQGLE